MSRGHPLVVIALTSKAAVKKAKGQGGRCSSRLGGAGRGAEARPLSKMLSIATTVSGVLRRVYQVSNNERSRNPACHLFTDHNETRRTSVTTFSYTDFHCLAPFPHRPMGCCSSTANMSSTPPSDQQPEHRPSPLPVPPPAPPSPVPEPPSGPLYRRHNRTQSTESSSSQNARPRAKTLGAPSSSRGSSPGPGLSTPGKSDA